MTPERLPQRTCASMDTCVPQRTCAWAHARPSVTHTQGAAWPAGPGEHLHDRNLDRRLPAADPRLRRRCTRIRGRRGPRRAHGHRLGESEELADAALRRADQVADRLGAIAHRAAVPRRRPNVASELDGVPTFLKDNVDVVGMPTNHGTTAFLAGPAREDGPYAAQFLASGMTVLGKTRLPEFGFNASTEFEGEGEEPSGTPGNRTSRSAAPPAEPPRWSLRASSRSRTPTTGVGRYASPLPPRDWSGSSRPAVGTSTIEQLGCSPST